MLEASYNRTGKTVQNLIMELNEKCFILNFCNKLVNSPLRSCRAILMNQPKVREQLSFLKNLLFSPRATQITQSHGEFSTMAQLGTHALGG